MAAPLAEAPVAPPDGGASEGPPFLGVPCVVSPLLGVWVTGGGVDGWPVVAGGGGLCGPCSSGQSSSGVTGGAVCAGAAVLAQSLPKAGLAAPTTSTELPQALTGMCTGAWTLFPATTPGDPVAAPEALEPEADLPPPVCAPPWCPEALAQLLPYAGFSTPTTSTVLPQALIGTSTGTCTEFPEATPGEPTAAPSAPAVALA